MTKTVESLNGKNLLLTLVFASILLMPIGISTNQAFAMGQAPSTCPNRYDSAITSMIIDNGTMTYDAVSNQDATFTADVNDGYKVTLTLHTADQSSNGNQDRGLTWYSEHVYGFGNGHCVDDVGPNEDKIINFAFNGYGKRTETDQNVLWHTIGGPDVTYNVDWTGQWNNSPAQPADDTAETTKNTPVTIDVLANDVDPDGDQLIINFISVDPENGNGTAVINSDNTITYTPNQDFVGSDLFAYYVSDGKQDGGWAMVTINVHDLPQNNNPPGAGDDFAETTIIPVTIDVLANDVDPDGDPLTVDSIVIIPQNGQATINSDNTITYTPNLGFIGQDAFEYMVSDGNGGSDTALVSISVNEIVGPLPIPISMLPLL